MLKHLATHPCVDCGESDVRVLDFDHRANKESDISRLVGKGRVAGIVREINKCDVRCANCHRRRHSGGTYRASTVDELKGKLWRAGYEMRMAECGQGSLFAHEALQSKHEDMPLQMVLMDEEIEAA